MSGRELKANIIPITDEGILVTDRIILGASILINNQLELVGKSNNNNLNLNKHQ